MVPSSVYGRFSDGSSAVLAETDANGVARSGSYSAGTSLGSHEVVGWVWSLSSQRNRDVLKGGDTPTAYFAVTQSSTSVDGYMSGNWYDLSLGASILPGHFQRYLRKRTVESLC